MATFEAKVTSKGQITLPAKVRDGLRVDVGDRVLFTESADGSFQLQARNRSLRDLKGLIRTGEKVSGRDIAEWIDEARGRAVSVAPAPRRRNRPHRS